MKILKKKLSENVGKSKVSNKMSEVSDNWSERLTVPSEKTTLSLKIRGGEAPNFGHKNLHGNLYWRKQEVDRGGSDNSDILNEPISFFSTDYIFRKIKNLHFLFSIFRINIMSIFFL